MAYLDSGYPSFFGGQFYILIDVSKRKDIQCPGTVLGFLVERLKVESVRSPVKGLRTRGCKGLGLRAQKMKP